MDKANTEIESYSVATQTQKTYLFQSFTPFHTRICVIPHGFSFMGCEKSSHLWSSRLVWRSPVSGSSPDLHRHFIRRFQPFVWMCVWTVLVTGVALTLFNPRFVFFQFEDRWSVLLGFKQVVFASMVLFSIGHARMFSLIDELMGKGETADHVAPFFRQMVLFGKLNIGLAIVTLGLAAALMS